MRLISYKWLIAATIFFPLVSPVSGLIIPRRAHPKEIAFHEQIAPIQAPLRGYRNPNFGLPRLNSRGDISLAAVNTTGTTRQFGAFPGYIRQNVTFLDGLSYYIPATLGEQCVNLIIDTGSSDTWVIKKDYGCDNKDDNFRSSWYCAFGPEFDPDISNSFQYLNQTDGSFAVAYADRTYVKGWVGQDLLNVSGIIVNQTVGLANVARWQGDGITSGILGLAYPGSIPSSPNHRPYDWLVTNKDDPDARGMATSEPDINFDCHDTYPSFIQSLAYQGYNPLFSISLQETRLDWGGHGPKPRPPEGGFIAFGGIPSVQNLGLPFAKAKMNPQVNGSTCVSDIRQIGYGFEIDGLTDGETVIYSGKRTVKLDTGASVMVFPYWLLQQFWKRVTPQPRWYDLKGGVWKVKCNATIPDLGFIIGGVVIKVDRNQLIRVTVDLDLEDEIENSEEMCSMNIMTNPWGDEVILGIPFLHGVLAVYDLANKEIRIAKRFAEDPTHIPVWSDKVSQKLGDHPPLVEKTATLNWVSTKQSTLFNTIMTDEAQGTVAPVPSFMYA